LGVIEAVPKNIRDDVFYSDGFTFAVSIHHLAFAANELFVSFDKNDFFVRIAIFTLAVFLSIAIVFAHASLVVVRIASFIWRLPFDWLTLDLAFTISIIYCAPIGDKLVTKASV
jgi:hypothetical protein